MAEQPKGTVLYGCKMMIVKEIDDETGLPKADGNVVYMETPQQANISLTWIDGQVTELRGGDGLVATVEEDDELTGADITFTDAILSGESLAMLAGGTYANGKYSAPRKPNAKPVWVELYQALYGEGNNHASDITGYRQYTFPNVKGRVPNFNLQDRNFVTPQFTLSAKESEKANLPVFEWDDVAELPAKEG